MVSGGIPSYNSGVMTETILHHTSSLDGTNELDGYRVRWNGQHEEMQHPRKIECSWAAVAVEPLPDVTIVLAAQNLPQLVLRYIADFQKSEQQVFATSVGGIDRRSSPRRILTRHEIPIRDLGIVRDVPRWILEFAFEYVARS